MVAAAPRVCGADVSRTPSTSAAGVDSLPPTPGRATAGSGWGARYGRVRSRGPRLVRPSFRGLCSPASRCGEGAAQCACADGRRRAAGGRGGLRRGAPAGRRGGIRWRPGVGDLDPKAVRRSGKVAPGPDGAAADATLVPAPRLRRTGPVRTEKSSQCAVHLSPRSRGARPLSSRRRAWARAPLSSPRRACWEAAGELLRAAGVPWLSRMLARPQWGGTWQLSAEAGPAPPAAPGPGGAVGEPSGSGAGGWGAGGALGGRLGRGVSRGTARQPGVRGTPMPLAGVWHCCPTPASAAREAALRWALRSDLGI